MKLEFTKLETSNETIEIDFGDGNGFKEYPVAEAKEYGIAIPDDINNFNEIKIQGSTGVITSPEVLKSIKLTGELHIKDFFYSANLRSTGERELTAKLFDAIEDFYFKNALTKPLFVDNSEYTYPSYTYNRSTIFYDIHSIRYSNNQQKFCFKYTYNNSVILIPITDTGIAVPDYFPLEQGVLSNSTWDGKRCPITENDVELRQLIAQLQQGVQLWLYNYHTPDLLQELPLKIFIDNVLDGDYQENTTSVYIK